MTGQNLFVLPAGLIFAVVIVKAFLRSMTKAEKEKGRRYANVLYGIYVEILVTLIPFVVYLLVGIFKPNRENVLDTPELAVAAAVLSGQGLLKLLRNVIGLNALEDNVERIVFLATVGQLFFLVAVVFVAAAALQAPEPWFVGPCSLILIAVSVNFFFASAGGTELLKHTFQKAAPTPPPFKATPCDAFVAAHASTASNLPARESSDEAFDALKNAGWIKLPNPGTSRIGYVDPTKTWVLKEQHYGCPCTLADWVPPRDGHHICCGANLAEVCNWQYENNRIQTGTKERLGEIFTWSASRKYIVMEYLEDIPEDGHLFAIPGYTDQTKSNFGRDRNGVIKMRDYAIMKQPLPKSSFA